MLDMPFKIIDSYVVMLPIIQAEEHRELLNIAMCGGGNASTKDVNSFITRLNRIASVRLPEKKQIPSTMKNAMISSLGVAVIDMRNKNLPKKYKKKLFPFNPNPKKG